MDNHEVNVNKSNNILGKIKEELSRVFSVLSYEKQYEDGAEEYNISSQNDSEIVRVLEESDKKFNDYDSYINSGLKAKRISKSGNTRKQSVKSSILHIEESKIKKSKEDDGRTI